MDLKINKEKFQIFLKVAKLLNKQGIIPILFGSLGLNRTIGEFGRANDIDILVPPEIINEKWHDLIKSMRGLGFKLKDEKEHEFIKNSEIVAFGKASDLAEINKINPDTLKMSEVDKVKFKELSAEHYFLCYQSMLRDHYRQKKRGKADKEKIALIRKYLREKDNN